MDEIFFLPTSEIPAFQAATTPLDKLITGAKALAKSHHVEYNDNNLHFTPDELPFVEPYLALRGFSIPLYADAEMMVEYLNQLYPDTFEIDASQEFQNICISYIPQQLN